MSEEKSYRRAAAIVAAVGLIAAFLIWRGGPDGGSRITTYQAAPALSATSVPQAETGHSLGVLADAHFVARRYDEAIALYRKMLTLDPRDAAVHNDLGLALHYTGKSDAAVAALKKATTLDPKLQRAWLSYGFVLTSIGREKEGRAALEKTIKLNPATAQGLEAKSMLQRAR